eukprot:m.266762 g.266762  ORF g.266762 m.266762 type:complete len:52 (+) comp40504_c0_seq103:1284-1439(+)
MVVILLEVPGNKQFIHLFHDDTPTSSDTDGGPASVAVCVVRVVYDINTSYS